MRKRFLREKIRHALSIHVGSIFLGGIALALMLLGASCTILLEHFSQ